MQQETKDTIKLYFNLTGILVLIFNTLVVTRQFIIAFLSESKTYTMNIDHYHEAVAEITLIILLFPIAAYAGYKAIKKIIKDYNERARN